MSKKMNNIFTPLEQDGDQSKDKNLVNNMIKNVYDFSGKKEELLRKEEEIYKRINENEKKEYRSLPPKEKIKFWTGYFNKALGKVLNLNNNNNNNTELSNKEAFQLIFSSKNFSNIFNNSNKSVSRHNLLNSLFRSAIMVAEDKKFRDIESKFKAGKKDNEMEEILNTIIKAFFSGRKIENVSIDDKKVEIQPKDDFKSGSIYLNDDKIDYTIIFDKNETQIKEFKIDENLPIAKYKNQLIKTLEQDLSINSMSIKLTSNDKNYTYKVISIEGGQNIYKKVLEEELLKRLRREDWKDENISLSSVLDNKILAKSGDNDYVRNYINWYLKAKRDGRYSGPIPDWYRKKFKKIKNSTKDEQDNNQNEEWEDEIEKMWTHEKKIFNALSNSAEETVLTSQEIFKNAVIKTLEQIKETPKDKITLNFGFTSYDINRTEIEKALKYFEDKFFKDLKKKVGLHLIEMMYSNKSQLGAEGEITALLELPKNFKSGGQTQDALLENEQKIKLGQSFQDIKGKEYGINVKHYLYQGDIISLYDENISVGAEKELVYKYTDRDTFNAINLYVLNRDFFGEDNIGEILKKDITKFMRMEWNGKYCLFYRLSNFYYPASVIYEECAKKGKTFFEMKYQDENSFQNMKKEHIENNKNYVGAYLNDEGYKNNKIKYGLKRLNIRELAGF